MQLPDVVIKGGLNFVLFRFATKVTKNFHCFEKTSNSNVAGGKSLISCSCVILLIAYPSWDSTHRNKNEDTSTVSFNMVMSRHFQVEICMGFFLINYLPFMFPLCYS